jgi:tripartite-type tricarboxylate transporter receptor subunit TctC
MVQPPVLLFARGLFCACVALLHLVPAVAQPAWPHKPVQLIVPWPAGGGTDIIARTVTQRLQARIGQPIVVDNRAGASGIIGTQAAANAVPDGYTLVLGVTNTHAINGTYFRKLPYDILKDFQPVSMLAVGPHVLVINPALPARSFGGLVALLKSQPGKHAFASYGNGSTAHLLGEQLKRADDLDITHVPYRGIPPALQDVMGGQVSMIFSTTAAALPLIRSGKLRALAVTAEHRLEGLPDVPTMIELKRPEATLNHWYGLLVPAGVPRPIVDRLAAETRAVLQGSDVKEVFEKAGVTPWPLNPDQFSAFMKEEIGRWGALVKAAGIVGD